MELNADPQSGLSSSKQTFIITVLAIKGKQTLAQSIYLYLDRYCSTGLMKIFYYIPEACYLFHVTS